MRRRQVSRTQTTSLARRFASTPSSKSYFLPTSIAGCQLWLDAADSSSIVKTGTSVTTWKDKSGNGYHMDTLTPKAGWTGTTAVYPTIGTSINGLQTVNFTAQAGLKQSTTLDGVKNLFWVGRIAAPVGSGDVSFMLFGDDANYDWHSNQYGGKFVHVSLTQSGIANASPTSLFTSDANAITNTAFSNVNMPSAPNVSLLSVGGITGSTRYQGICYDRTYNVGWCGDLAEVITFTTALTTAQRQAVEGYLAHKWGLTKYYSPSFPLSISGCQLWLDAADSSTITGTSSVTAWRDKSTNGYVANSFVNSVANPSLVPNVQNGNSVIQYSAGNGSSIANFVLAQKMSIFMIYYPINQSAGNPFLEHGPNANNESGFYLFSGGGQNFAINSGSTYPGVNYGNTTVSNTWQMIEGINPDPANSNTMSYYANGTTMVSGLTQSGTNTITKTLYINGRGGANNVSYNTYLAELIIYNKGLTATERQQVEAYLARKWGIVIKESFLSTHPYANFIPSPLTEFIPKTITGCQLWLDGADPDGTAIIPANGATISTWKDKSGNTKNATVASGRVAGTYSSSLRAVNFATSSTGYGTAYPANPTNETMFVVFNNAAPSSLNNILIGGQGGARSLGAGYTASGTGYVGNLNNGIVWLANTSPYTSGTTALVTSDFTSSTNSVSLNGGTAVSGGAPGFTSGTTTFIGVDTRDLGYYYVGHAMEIIFFNSVLTTAQRQQVEGYLALKWGLTGSLPSDHPYKSFSPFPVISVNFVPTSIAGCQLWLDASDKTAMTLSGTSVVTVLDKSGNGKTLTGGTGWTYNVTKFNGIYPSFYRATTGSMLGQNTTFSLSSSNITLFFVGMLESAGSTSLFAYLIDGGGVDTGRFYNFVEYTGGLDNTNLYHGDTQTTVNYPITNRRIFSPFIFSQSAGTNPHTGSINGIEFSASSGNIGSMTVTGLTIGASWNITSNPGVQPYTWPGHICEVLIYNKALSTFERQQVESYLAWKWGLQASLPSDHTYKFAPPSV